MNVIQIQQKFNAPVGGVFELLAKHDTYNQIFKPVKLVKIQDSIDLSRPDGVESIRKVVLGPVSLLKEQITLLEENKRIEYQIIKSPLVKYHLGRIDFEVLDEKTTLVIYTIELKTYIPFLTKILLAQLKSAIKLGLSKLAKTVEVRLENE